MSKIEWTHLTWNPTTGCDKISAGCRFCYAEIMHKRLRGMGQKKYQHKFLGDVHTHPDDLDKPKNMPGNKMIFVDSMSDLFHKDVPFEFILRVFIVMMECDQHIFQILTKRIDRAVDFYEWMRKQYVETRLWDKVKWPLPNVWLGTSVENQEMANERIPHLAKITAAVKFLSCEPLIGPIDLSTSFPMRSLQSQFDWVIVGGESGNKNGVRPMHLDWVRSLRDQCKEAEVRFFFKQWGTYRPAVFPAEAVGWKKKIYMKIDGTFRKPTYMKQDDEILMLGTNGKQHGNYLDGVQHLEFPA